MGKGYPDGVLERLQGVELEVLRAVAAVCDQLGLTWFIDSGTCLGAVRHGGFIPWDDDIDIGLPLADYQVFCEKAPDLLPEGFGLYTHASTPNYPPLWAKAYKKGTRFMGRQMVDAGLEEGVFVDVFAYTRLDSDERVAQKQIRDAALWQRVSYLYHTAHPKIPADAPLRPLLAAGCVAAHGLIKLAMNPQGIERRFERVFSGKDQKGPWCNIFYPTCGTFAEEELFPPQPIAFEDCVFPAPRNTHAYLTTLYGDYMTPPPVERQAEFPPVILDFGDGVNVMDTSSGC